MGGISNAILHIWLKTEQEMDLKKAISQVKEIFLKGVKEEREVADR
jgi:hypothetical protein